MSRTADKQPGEKLFKALRVLEIAFLNDAGTVQTGVEALLKDHKCSWVHDMGKYLVAQSIVVKDVQHSSRSKPYYYYNGNRLTVQYCNDLYLQMKIEKAADDQIVKNKAAVDDQAKVDILAGPTAADGIGRTVDSDGNQVTYIKTLDDQVKVDIDVALDIINVAAVGDQYIDHKVNTFRSELDLLQVEQLERKADIEALQAQLKHKEYMYKDHAIVYTWLVKKLEKQLNK